MTVRSLALAALLAVAALPTIASADSLHGERRARRVVVTTTRPGHHGYAHRVHGQRVSVRRTTVHRPPVRHVPVTRVHVHRHEHCNYVAGHHVVRRQRVIVPGYYVERVVPARYELRWRGFGHGSVRVLVERRHTVRDWVPERVEVRRRRVWVRGRWICS